MKIQTYDTTLVYDIVNHLREKGLPSETTGYIRFLLEDNIPMRLFIDGKLYETSWIYYTQFVNAHGDLVGSVNEDTIYHYELAKTELIKNAQELTEYAINY